mgnify:CR=1 FL=1|tara:strand:+ start:5275 stop:5529 length:255 start_codon:yes stop_codon:yes gene_type:complete
MNYFKIFCFIISVVFFSAIIKNYFSDSFLNKKKLARENYDTFLKKEIKKINLINSQKNFKKFKDNSKYFKTNEEKEFWKLLRTK